MNSITNRTIEKEKEIFDYIELEYQPDKPVDFFIQNLNDYPLNDNFIIGFIDGDGSFHISFKKNKKIQIGFHITQHNSEHYLLQKVKEYFGCGTIKNKSESVIRYQIDNFSDIYFILIPFIDKYILHTNKSVHFNIFKQICSIIKKGNLTDEDMIKIIELGYNMNKGGKRRKFTQEEYLGEINSHI